MSYTQLVKYLSEIAMIEARTKTELQIIGEQFKAEIRVTAQNFRENPNG